MNRAFTTRLAARGILRSTSAAVAAPQRYVEPASRWRTFASEPPPGKDTTFTGFRGPGGMSALTGLLNPNAKTTPGVSQYADILNDDAKPSGEDGAPDSAAAAHEPEPFHFHIYSHKHNTHVTVTRPNREPIISMSCGQIGFRKSARKSYDAAYQLGALVIDKLQQAGWHHKIHALEVILRGFGPGREAVTKVLLGSEGRLLRPKIERVADSTRLKFGGTRSKKPRRLG